jgi:hypothetical protein
MDLSQWLDLLIIVGAMFLHELAHFRDAKRQGIFRKVFFTGLTMGVALTALFKYRWNYIGGIIFSFLLYPVVLWLASASLIQAKWWWVYPVFCVSVGCVDLIAFFAFKKTWKNKKFDIVSRKDYKKLKFITILLGGMPPDIIWVD